MINSTGQESIDVLSLEDSPLDGELILDRLRSTFDVRSFTRVSDREEYIAALKAGTFDLVLADHALPNFDGVSALDISRELAKDVPFIFVSGTLGEEVAIECMQRGASDYVLKHRLERLCPVAAKAIAAAREKKILALASSALQHSEKLAIVGRLAATIAHEINNPLEAAVNLLFLARQEKSAQVSPLKDTLALLEQQLNRVMSISKQTLSFYRESSHPMQVRIDDIARDTVQLFQRKYDASRVTLSAYIEDGATVLGFPGEIHQLLCNLIGNALDASRERSSVVLRVRSAGDAVVITVADSGHGIAASRLPRIFEPFFTTKGEKGTGLGLWVTNGIVYKHHGSIRVRSCTTDGHSGTTFRVRLPKSVEKAKAHRQSESRVSA